MDDRINITKRPIAAAIKLACIGTMYINAAAAGPVLDGVAPSGVAITTVSGATEVDINADFAQINWGEFNVADGESVNFDFYDGAADNASWLVVNNINASNGISDIAGAISSNGHVLLINPRGVIFSDTSTVNVAALTVSALSASVADPNGGALEFSVLSSGDANDKGVIVNAGTVTAGSGVTLIGKSIQNSGDVVVSAGEIHMVSAEGATLTFDSGNLIGVQVTKEVLSDELGVTDAVLNSGNLEAASVILEASVKDALFSSAVNNTGTITATGINTDGGVVTLTGSVVPGAGAITTTAVNNSGDLVAPGNIAGGSGGTVSLSGADIVHSGTISADAVLDGNGGSVEISADDTLTLSGDISARGAGVGYLGGQITTAAANTVVFDSDTVSIETDSVDAAAGSWRLESGWLRVSDCTENCITGAALSAALDNNASVTLAAHNLSSNPSGDGVAVNQRVGWTSGATLILDSSTSASISGIPNQGGPKHIDGDGTLVVNTVDGFTNSNSVHVSGFQLNLTSADAGSISSSDLGDLNVAGIISVTGSAGYDIVLLGETTGNADLSVGQNGGVSVSGSGGQIASLEDIEELGAASSDSLLGTDQDDEFTLLDDNAFAFHDIKFSGLKNLDGGLGTDTIVAGENVNWQLDNNSVSQFDVFDSVTGIEVLDADGGAVTTTAGNHDFTLSITPQTEQQLIHTQTGYLFTSVGNVVNSGASAVSLNAAALGSSALYLQDATANSLTTALSGGIQFTGLSSVTAARLDTNGQDIAVSIEGLASAKIGNVTFNGLSGMSGSVGDSVSGGDSWQLQSGQSALNTESSIEFSGAWYVTTSNGVLAGTGQDDSFVLANDGVVEVSTLRFAGLGAVNGGAGVDSLDASSFAVGDNAIFLQSADGSSVSTADSAGLQFTGLSTITAANLDTNGQNAAVNIQGLNSAQIGSVVFNGITEFSGSSGDSVAGGDNWTLQDSQSALNSESAIVFAGAWDVATSTGELAGTSQGDSFVLASNGVVEAGTLKFSSLSLVNGGGGADSLDASDYTSGGNALFLTSTDGGVLSTAGTGGLVFDGLSSVTAATLDTNGQGVMFNITGANSGAIGSVTFNGLADVVGSAGDSVSGGNNWTLQESQSAINADSDIAFTGAWNVATANGVLTGSGQADNFIFDNNGVVEASSLKFSGLASVDGGAGADSLEASAYAVGDNRLFLRSADGSSVSTAGVGGLQLSSLSSVTAGNLDTNGLDVTFNIIGVNSGLIGSVAFSGLSEIAGSAGDSVSGGNNWTIQDSQSAINSDSNIVFAGSWDVTTTAGVLSGSDQADNFTLENGGVVRAGTLGFSGLASVTGGTGADTLDASASADQMFTLFADNTITVQGLTFGGLESVVAGGDGELDASVYTNGVSLYASDAVDASGLIISGLSDVNVPLLLGTAADETFSVTGGGGSATVTVDGYDIVFDGVTEVRGGEGSGDADSVVMPENSVFAVTADVFAQVSGIKFSEIEVLDLNSGTLTGTDVNDDFTLVDGNTVSHAANTGYVFRNMQQVVGGLGATTLDASALGGAALFLASADGSSVATADNGGIQFNGLSSVSTALLDTNGLGATFNVSGANSGSIGSVIFSGLSGVTGSDGDSVTGGNNWTLQDSQSAINTDSNILFSGAWDITTIDGMLVGSDQDDNFVLTNTGSIETGTLTFFDLAAVSGGAGSDNLDASTSADQLFSLAAGNIINVHGMDFSGLANVVAGGSGELNASAYAGGLALNGTSGTTIAGDLTISGLSNVTATSLTGSSGADAFTVDELGNIEVLDMLFAGVSEVYAGSANNVAVGADGESWFLQSPTSAINSNVTFTGFHSLEAVSAGLVGTTGDDNFLLQGNNSSNATVSVFDMVFANLTGVDGGGHVSGDHLDAATYADSLALTGVDGELNADGLVFSNIESAALSNLVGHSGDDEFTITGNRAISVAGMDISDLSEVDGGQGDNVLYAGGEATLDKNGGVTASEIFFTNITDISVDSLAATDEDDELVVNIDGTLTLNGVNLAAVTSIDAKGGVDRAIGADGQDWTISGLLSASNNGILFNNIEVLEAINAGVYGTESADSFVLAANGLVSVAGMTVSGMSFVDGRGGADSIDASAFAAGLALTNTSGQLNAGALEIFGIESAITGIITATSNADEFLLTGSANRLQASGIEFDGVTTVIGNGGGDRLNGSGGDDTFELRANGDIATAGVVFSGISAVDSGQGSDTVMGSGASWSSATTAANDQLVDGGAIAAVDSITVLFQNLERVENADAYSGPTFGADYRLVGVNSLNIGGVTFAGLDSISAGGGMDTLYGTDADLSWTVKNGQSNLSDGTSSLNFSGFESIVAGSGADRFDLNAGALTSLNTGGGDDIVNVQGTVIDSLYLGAGNDLVSVFSASQPLKLYAGAGNDLMQMHVSGQQWQINGNSAKQNQVGNLLFTGFEAVEDTTGGLNLATNQQFNFTAGEGSAGVLFGADGMTLTYSPDGDLVLVSTGTGIIGGSLKARSADLTLAGDLDIESDVGNLSLRSSAGDIDVAILAKQDLQIGQIDAQRGSVWLASASADAGSSGALGLLTAETFGETHIIAGNIQLGTGRYRWGNIGTELNPLRMDVTESLHIVALSYFEPAYVSQQPGLFSATGDRLESVAGAQTAQGLKSVVQSPVEDIAQLDPGIFDAVTPYSLGVDPLNLPEFRLQAGELVPLDEREEERRRRAQEAAAGGGR